MGESTERFVRRLLKLASKGKVDVLVREAMEYVASNRGDVWVALKAADVLSSLGRLEEAREILELLEKRTPEVIFALSRLLSVKFGALDEALKVAESGLKEFGDHPLVVAAYAGALLKMGRKSEALEMVNSALEKHPDNPDLLNIKAWIMIGQDLDEAEKLARKALEKKEHYSLKFLLAEILERKQRYREAEKLAKEAIEENPFHIPSYKLLYDVYYGFRRFKDALKIADKLLRMNPINPEFLYLKGAALFALRKFDKALEYFDRALEVDPNHIDALILRGDVLDVLGRVDEALESYKKALEVKPDDPVVLSKIADVLIEQGRLNEARVYLERAEKSGGRKETVYWYAKGNLFKAMGKTKEAAECYKMAAKISGTPLTQGIVEKELKSLGE